jgi:hypothetical protein
VGKNGRKNGGKDEGRRWKEVEGKEGGGRNERDQRRQW